MKSLTLIKNKRGITSMDFLFAMVLVMGFSSILFALSLTLSVVEVSQYIVFASSRSYFGADISKDAQKNSAKLKFQQLKSNSVFAPFYSGGWYELSETPDHIGDHTENGGGSLSTVGPFTSEDTNRFVGVSTNLTAGIMDFNIPFFGSTSPSGDGTGADFITGVGSFLSREPTFNECMGFNGQRWEKLKALDSKYSAAGNTKDNAIADNGC